MVSRGEQALEEAAIISSDNISSLSPRGQWLFAIAFWVAGLAIMAVAVGWITLPPQSIHAPRWVVGFVGLSFFACGFAPIAARLGPASLMSQIVGGGVVLPFTAVMNWVAFGPGPRQFSGGLSVGFVSVSHQSSEMSGRIAFGIGAVLLDILVLSIVIRGLRRKLMTG